MFASDHCILVPMNLYFHGRPRRRPLCVSQRFPPVPPIYIYRVNTKVQSPDILHYSISPLCTKDLVNHLRLQKKTEKLLSKLGIGDHERKGTTVRPYTVIHSSRRSSNRQAAWPQTGSSEYTYSIPVDSGPDITAYRDPSQPCSSEETMHGATNVH
jgi:hypothetical protein